MEWNGLFVHLHLVWGCHCCLSTRNRPHANSLELFISLGSKSHGESYKGVIFEVGYDIDVFLLVVSHWLSDACLLLTRLVFTFELNGHALALRRLGENKVCKLCVAIDTFLFANVRTFELEIFLELEFEL